MLPRSVFVPLDGSPFAERAIPIARALSDQFGADLVLLTARWDDVPHRAQEYIEQIGAEHEADHIMYIGDRGAADAIELVVDEGDDRIVCMTSHGRGRLRWSMLGSVAEEVVRRVHHPIVVVGRHCAREWPNGFRHGVVCLDGSRTDDPIVPIAEAWAAQLGLRLHTAQAIHPLDVEGAAAPNPAIDEIVTHMKQRGVTADSAVARGSWVPGALVDHAAKFPDALVMMSSHGRTGMPRFALGSVSMAVVSMSASPVLLTRSS